MTIPDLTSNLPGALQSDIPIEAAQDSEPLKGVEDKAIVARLQQIRKSCEDHASARYTTIRRQWRLYYERYDFSKKQEWQSKISVPRTFQTVESAVALYLGGLIPSENWFRVEDKWQGLAGREYTVTEMQKQNLEAAGFYDMMRLGLMSGFLGGTIPVKVGLDSRADIPYPVHLLWDPLDVKMDWSGRNRFLMLESEVDPYQLQEWAEQGLFEESRVEEALKTSAPEDLASKRNPWDTAIPTFSAQEFWGDLTDSEGKLWMKNCHCLVINKQVLLRRPIENPYAWQGPPVIIGSPLRAPYRVWQAGLIEHVSGLARMMTELANAVMDASLFASVQAYQYDIDRVRASDLRRGIYPGKMFGITQSHMGPAIERFEAGSVPTDAMGVVRWLDQEMQRDTNITEHTTGSDPPGGRSKTATEVSRYHQQSMGIMRTMARDLEQSFLEPLLDITLSMFAQVTSKNPAAFLKPELLKALGPQLMLQLQFMDDETRAEVLGKGIRHKARGISSSIAMNEDLQRLLAFAEAAAKSPELWGRVNKRVLLEKMVSLHRQSPDELLIPEEQFQQQQQQMAQQMAMMQAQAQQGSGGQLVQRRTQQMPGEPRRLPVAG